MPPALDAPAESRAPEPLDARGLGPGCPAYPEEERGVRRAYCVADASPHRESIEPKDCLCESCEVNKGGRYYGRTFFCLAGKAIEDDLRDARLARGELGEGVAPPATFATAAGDANRAPGVSPGADARTR